MYGTSCSCCISTWISGCIGDSIVCDTTWIDVICTTCSYRTNIVWIIIDRCCSGILILSTTICLYNRERILSIDRDDRWCRVWSDIHCTIHASSIPRMIRITILDRRCSRRRCIYISIISHSISSRNHYTPTTISVGIIITRYPELIISTPDWYGYICISIKCDHWSYGIWNDIYYTTSARCISSTIGTTIVEMRATRERSIYSSIISDSIPTCYIYSKSSISIVCTISPCISERSVLHYFLRIIPIECKDWWLSIRDHIYCSESGASISSIIYGGKCTGIASRVRSIHIS